jgi:hypothetical protein
MLNAPDVRKKIHQYIEQLSPDRLVVALDFLAYLVERDHEDATAELLSIPGFADELKAAEQEADTQALSDWRSLRSDV